MCHFMRVWPEREHILTVNVELQAVASVAVHLPRAKNSACLGLLLLQRNTTVPV